MFSCGACDNTRRPGARTFLRRLLHVSDRTECVALLMRPQFTSSSWWTSGAGCVMPVVVLVLVAREPRVHVATQGLGDASPRDLAQSATFHPITCRHGRCRYGGHDEATSLESTRSRLRLWHGDRGHPGASAACDRSDATAARQAPPPPEVVVHTVGPEAVTLTTELPGRTAPYGIAEVRP